MWEPYARGPPTDLKRVESQTCPFALPFRWTRSIASTFAAIRRSPFCSKRKSAVTIFSITRRPACRFAKASCSHAGKRLKVEDKHGAHYALSDPRVVDLSERDVVLLRQDPPFDMAYITTTHLLERIHPKTLVVNDPAHVRNAPEKLFVLDFLDLMPPTLVTRSLADVQAFRAEYKDIIVKPLYGNGGAAVFRIKPDDGNLASLVELFQTVFREPFMVQEFRPEVKEGDKRIILVDGDVAGAINRVPQAGETRSNLHVGGTATAIDLNDARPRNLRAPRAGT